ncbi:MAG TPA: hypothetical protein VNI01_15215 [Elusimicrobiota bacterium]|jgi:4-amino-4-deoxy-L-arabinose transferase-like glycosyltransferase|nr:hypothetical protein [Elusimicrobiota bacterium]
MKKEWALPAALALLLPILLLLGTPWGLCLSPDSIPYLLASRILAGAGSLAQLPNQWPPFYPALLALAKTATGAPELLSARLLNAALLATNVLLLAALFKRAGRPPLETGALLILTALQPSFINVHLRLLSEPAFLCLALLDALLLDAWLRGKGTWTAAALGLVAGLAYVTRYAGLFLLALNASAMLLFARPDRRTARARSAAISTAIALLPVLAWSAFNWRLGRNASGRPLAWHPADASHLLQGVRAVAAWLRIPGLLGVLLGLLMRRREPPAAPAEPPLTRVFVLYGALYLALVLLSVSVIDFTIEIDERILLLLLPPVLFLLSRAIPSSRRTRPALALIALGLAMNLRPTWLLWSESRRDGLGFARKGLSNAPIMEVLRGLPSDLRVRTNGSELFQLYLKQTPRDLPIRLDPVTQRLNERFDEEMRGMSRDADAIVLFSFITWRYYNPSRSELSGLPGFRTAYDRPDGVIWLRKGSLP